MGRGFVIVHYVCHLGHRVGNEHFRYATQDSLSARRKECIAYVGPKFFVVPSALRASCGAPAIHHEIVYLNHRVSMRACELSKSAHACGIVPHRFVVRVAK